MKQNEPIMRYSMQYSMNTEEIIKSLSTINMSWRHVEGLVCVHTFYKDFFINLCAYNNNGSPVIALNVDNVKKNISDIIDKEFDETTKEYVVLLKVYNDALVRSQTIPSGSIA